MKYAWFQLRCFIGETFFRWGMEIMPHGSKEELASAYALKEYVERLKP
jgi:hypothetical protein